MTRPVEVTPICLVLIASSVVGLYSYGDERGWVVELSAIISTIVIFFVVLGFWLGDRWCHRLLVFFLAYAMIRPVILVFDPPAFDRFVILVEAALAFPLLIWLFTRRINTFTQQVRTPPKDQE